MRWMRALSLVTLAACGRADRPPAPGELPAPAATGRSGASGAGGPVADAAVVLRGDPAAGRRHLERGRLLGRARRWTDAHAELAVGCAQDPGDPVLWCELSWASVMAGEPARARDEAERAAALAHAAGDARHEAAARYNLGRAAEQLGERDAARGHYAASYALRPSDIVARRLERLERPTRACAAPDPIPCEAGPAARLCACLAAAAAGQGDDDPDAPSPTPPGGAPRCVAALRLDLGAPAGTVAAVPGAGGAATTGSPPTAGARVELWRVGWSDRDEDQTGAYLVEVTGARARPLATVAVGLDGGRTWSRALARGGLELRAAGGTRYLWATAEVASSEEPVVGDEVLETVETVRVCPLAPAPRCTLAVPLRTTLRARLDLAAIPEPDAQRRRLEFRRMWGAPPPVVRTHDLDVSIAADGRAEVVPAAGTSGDDVAEWTGTYRAW